MTVHDVIFNAIYEVDDDGIGTENGERMAAAVVKALGEAGYEIRRSAALKMDEIEEHARASGHTDEEIASFKRLFDMGAIQFAVVGSDIYWRRTPRGLDVLKASLVPRSPSDLKRMTTT